ncbi:MAG: SBBP repeat-containing protein, partial [Ferruginibacter sp.]
MRYFILQRLLVLTLLIVMNTVNAQPGSGWDWAATSTKATPSPGRQIRDIVTDASGNVYAVGDFAGTMTMGSATLTTTGDGSVNYNYDFDAFVVKYNATGTVLWAKQFGVAGVAANDRGEVINVDGNGNVYIGGNSGVPFLVKYDNNGNLLWNKSFTLYDLGGINFGPDGNPIIMESDQGSKNIYKIDKANGNILWTVSNTGVGSNSTSTFQDFVDLAGNVYFTAFRINGGVVTVAGNSYSPTQTTTYIASVDNNGSTRWVDVLSNVQVQLSYTIDKNGKSYVSIGGGFGSSFQGVPISGTPANGNTYLELNSSGTLVSYKSISPFKALMRVTNNGIYSYGVNAGSSYGSYTEVYGNNIIKSRAGTGNDLGVIIKYDLNTYQPLWANSYEANGSNYLNTIEIAANGKCLAGGAYQTSVKFGASLYTPATIGTAYFAFDFFLAQFNSSNVAPSPTTTWTGNSNNGDWNDAGNWSNGAPNGNEKATIPAGVSNYPINITTANSTGKLTVANGVSIALPVGFDAPVGIVNDGSIEVKGAGTFQGFNTSYVNYLSGSGKLVFTANSPSAILYNINNSLEVNKPGGTLQWNGGTISGSISLTAGILNGAFPIVLTDPNATITYSSTGYMNGTLKRAVNSSGTYVFPMGNSGLYAPVTLTLNNITGTQNISIIFPESFAQTAGTTPNINLGGKTITSKLNNNQWVITPDVALTGG